MKQKMSEDIIRRFIAEGVRIGKKGKLRKIKWDLTHLI